MERSLQSRTFSLEMIRAVATGVFEVGVTTFFLLGAVRYFDAGPLAKGIVAGGTNFGFLLAPLVVMVVRRLRVRVTAAAAAVLAFAALALSVTVAQLSLPVYVAGVFVTTASASAIVPLLTQMYLSNYSGPVRGRLYSTTNSLRVASSIAAALLIGYAADGALDRIFHVVLLLFAAALLTACGTLARCPSQPLPAAGTAVTSHPRALRDTLFLHALASWMLLGFGNLMILPLRVEYLANPRHGLSLTEGIVTLMVSVIPNCARLVLSPIWGRLFDRVDFFRMRAVLNVGFLLGISSFFLTSSWTGLVVGSLLIGVSNAGADVAWNLWVTKIAPAERTAEYMAIHTFLTGVRGVLAPIVGFQLIESIGLGGLGWLSIALIAVSIFVLPKRLPERAGTPDLPEATLASVEDPSAAGAQ